ncbi:MAG: transposase family protein [Deltaproteobacteria bacterium]|nr:MAG: transposase family protein [Deltaproteobacteria bacterium]
MPSSLLSIVPGALKLSRLQPARDHVILEATSQETAVPCPDCDLSSRRLHSFYSRVLRDLPWQGRPATIRVAARRFRCLNTACHRKTFAEHLGAVARRSARRTTRLSDLQRHVGFALGGEAAARLATRLAIPTSADTMLHLLASVDIAEQITAIDAALRALCRADAELKARLDILVSIPAIGEATALIEMPELGTMDNKCVASLAGLAPGRP